MRKHLQPAKANSRFLINLPTGVGKTLVMALAPFLMDANKVLIVVPNLTILSQVQKKLSEFYNREHPVAKTGDVRVTVQRFNNGHAPEKCDVIVANIQALVDRKQDEKEKAEPAVEADAQDTDAEAGIAITVKQNAKILLNDHKPDFVLVDEGHHNPANSWEVLSKEVLETNQNCKFLLLTATPQRGDGRTYALNNDQFYYMYTRQEAINNKYIKETTYVKVDFDFEQPKKLSRYEDRAYMRAILHPAAKQLLQLRKSCNNEPIRMLVTARTNKAASTVATYFNELSEQERWGLSAVAITGETKKDNVWNLYHYGSASAGSTSNIDVAVQCRMLGEGYDNSFIAVSVFLYPPKTLGPLAQTHGRAIRKPVKELSQYTQSMHAYMFYPKEIETLVDSYKAGEDESTACMFAEVEFKSLKHAHIKLGKVSTKEGIDKLREHFQEYHDLYADKRANWTFIPADDLADQIYDTYIGDKNPIDDFKIVDFGCGIDGLFEERLAKRVHQRDGPGKVTTLALDVVALASAKDLEQMGADVVDNMHTEFVCDTIAGDYNTVLLDSADSSKYYAQFDVGIFCLSFLFEDALGLALLTATRVIKPMREIYIVVSLWGLNINFKYTTRPKIEEQLKTWAEQFQEKTGFKVKKIENKTGYAFIEVQNLALDSVSSDLESKLSGIKLKDLRIENSLDRNKGTKRKFTDHHSNE